MFEDSPVKQILFDTLVQLGRLDSNPSNSTIQTIRDISDSDALKILYSLPGGGPELKNMGGMMDINNMTRPLQSYKHGGIHITPKIKPKLKLKPKPKPKPKIVPKEELIDFDKLMAEFNKPENKSGPGEQSMLSKIINIGDPVIDREFQFRQFIKKMLGILPKE